MFPSVARRAFWALILIGVAASFSYAQQPRLSPEKHTEIEAAVAKFMSSTHVPGLSVAVLENGEFEWANGFGFAGLENNSPATEHTLFRLGSISKTLTAVGALELWERGRLDLDAPVQKYCPAFPEKSATITTREVMGHLGGIRHYKGGPGDVEIGNTRHFDDPIQGGLDFFKNDPLVALPGSHFHYSTQGYTLVGCVMQGASNSRYVDYMLKNVFAPAGMDQTSVDNRLAIIPYRTRFYQKTKDGTVENADFLDSSYKIPGGGWLSSAVDMARFEVAVLHDKLLKPATRQLMWTPLKPSDGSKDDYGLGWDNNDYDGIKSVGHNGGQQGCSTSFLIAPAQRAGVVVLTNMEEINPSKLAAEILKILVSDGSTQK
ncbi:MAG TPA: serine hydrolase domain-containing protein [Candidatus Sulfotelmatobacter sp.]|nr:serine hydrolase domain-containing protein [Candidatus Sulfotelmatobacter sp.]